MNKTYVVSILALLFLCSLSTTGQNVTEKESLTGSWLGKIRAGAIELRVIFNLSVVEKDSLVATLDSPDQGAKNIKLGQVTLTGDSLKISAPILLAECAAIEETFSPEALKITSDWILGLY